MVGYGFLGIGLTGAVDFASWDGRKWAGENTVIVYNTEGFETLGVGRANERLLVADFDHPDDPDQSTWSPGEPVAMETLVSSGDSGGPVFAEGQVVVIHNSVVELDGSCPGHTRMRTFRDWINDIIAGSGQDAGALADASDPLPEQVGTGGNWAVYSAQPHVFLPGDANHSSSVDDGDLSISLSGWQQWGIWLSGDFSGDGSADDDDLSLLLANWTGGAAVPAPATMVLLVMGGFLVIHRRRRSR